MTPVAALLAMKDSAPSLHNVVGPWLRQHGSGIHDREALVVLFDSSHWMDYRADANLVLSAPERERALRFRQDRHRDAYVMAHAVWRLVLAEVLGVVPDDVPLANTTNGQPRLPGTGYATSLSHSGNGVAIAIARAGCIGIDIEPSQPRTGMGDLIKVVCTPDEASALSRLEPSLRDAAMLALWTRKEALLKAFGVGLLATPSTIGVDIGVAIPPPAQACEMPACVVHPLTLPEGWMGALAAPAPISALRVLALPMRSTDVVMHASEVRPVM
jgi:4'-phosphopantetheinyl transferase